jgi:hypothetical protein
MVAKLPGQNSPVGQERSLVTGRCPAVLPVSQVPRAATIAAHLAQPATA